LQKDHALQLLLIIDYIFDWARDVYRPSILRQLKSIASGKAYDQVSFILDNDIPSLRKGASTWIQPIPGILPNHDQEFESGLAADSTSKPRQFLPFEISETHFGSIRSASFSKQKVTGVCLTDHDVDEFLQEAIKNNFDKAKSKEATARDILRCFIYEVSGHSNKIERPKWKKHAIILSGSDIQALEESWVGDVTVTSKTPTLPPDEKFYCLISFECFLSSSWEIEKQITYLAVTSKAFNGLAKFANYKISIPEFLATSETWAARLNDTMLHECLNCLSSASSSQSLLAALSAKSFAWCIKRELENVIDFDYNALWAQGYVIEKHLKVIQRTIVDKIRVGSLFKEFQTKSEKRRHEDTTAMAYFRFCRVFENVITIPDDQKHVASECLRCTQSGRPHRLTSPLRGHKDSTPEFSSDLVDAILMSQPWKMLRTSYEPWDEEIINSTNGMVLVEGLDVPRKGANFSNPKVGYWHDLCIFVIHSSNQPKSLQDVIKTIEAIRKNGQMYHTLKSPSRGWRSLFDLRYTPIVMWNLPMSYRPIFPKLANDILNWLSELNGKQPIEPTANDTHVPPLTILNQFYYGLLEEQIPSEDVLTEVYERRQANWLKRVPSVSTRTTLYS